MFVSSGQFYVFIATVAFGGVCGVLFSVSALLKYKLRNYIVRIFLDLIAFLITSFLYVAYSKWLAFPNFRIYMAVGVILGLILYFKSFHILLAKSAKVLYNKCDKVFIKIKIRNKRKDG